MGHILQMHCTAQTTLISKNLTNEPTNDALTTTSPFTPIGVTRPTGDHHVVWCQSNHHRKIIDWFITHGALVNDLHHLIYYSGWAIKRYWNLDVFVCN